MSISSTQKKETADRGGKPGEVVQVSAHSFTVAALGGAIEVLRVRPEGGRKVAAEDFIHEVGLQSGARFGNA